MFEHIQSAIQYTYPISDVVSLVFPKRFKRNTRLNVRHWIVGPLLIDWILIGLGPPFSLQGRIF